MLHAVALFPSSTVRSSSVRSDRAESLSLALFVRASPELVLLGVSKSISSTIFFFLDTIALNWTAHVEFWIALLGVAILLGICRANAERARQQFSISFRIISFWSGVSNYGFNGRLGIAFGGLVGKLTSFLAGLIAKILQKVLVSGRQLRAIGCGSSWWSQNWYRIDHSALGCQVIVDDVIYPGLALLGVGLGWMSSLVFDGVHTAVRVRTRFIQPSSLLVDGSATDGQFSSRRLPTINRLSISIQTKSVPCL